MIRWTDKMLEEKKAELQKLEIEDPNIRRGIVGELIEEIFCARALEINANHAVTRMTKDMEDWKAAYYRSEQEKQPKQDKIRQQHEKIKRLEEQVDLMKDERTGRERRKID